MAQKMQHNYQSSKMKKDDKFYANTARERKTDVTM